MLVPDDPFAQTHFNRDVVAADLRRVAERAVPDRADTQDPAVADRRGRVLLTRLPDDRARLDVVGPHRQFHFRLLVGPLDQRDFGDRGSAPRQEAGNGRLFGAVDQLVTVGPDGAGRDLQDVVGVFLLLLQEDAVGRQLLPEKRQEIFLVGRRNAVRLHKDFPAGQGVEVEFVDGVLHRRRNQQLFRRRARGIGKFRGSAPRGKENCQRDESRHRQESHRFVPRFL